MSLLKDLLLNDLNLLLLGNLSSNRMSLLHLLSKYTLKCTIFLFLFTYILFFHSYHSYLLFLLKAVRRDPLRSIQIGQKILIFYNLHLPNYKVYMHSIFLIKDKTRESYLR